MLKLLGRLEDTKCECIVCNHSFKLYDFLNFDLNEDTDKEYIDVTTKLLKQEYDYLNGKFFGNKLGNYPLKINKKKTAAGLTNLSVSYNGSDKVYTVTSVEISIWQHVTMAALRSVIAHEMVHVYMAENGIEAGHGPAFVSEMNRINGSKPGFEIQLTRKVDDTEVAFKGGKKYGVFLLKSEAAPNAFFKVDFKNTKNAAEALIVLIGNGFSPYKDFDVWISQYPILDKYPVLRVSSLENGKISLYRLDKEDDRIEIKNGEYAGHVSGEGYDNKGAKIDLGIDKAEVGEKKIDAVSHIVIMMGDVAAMVLPYKEKDHAIAWLGKGYEIIKNGDPLAMYKSSLYWLRALVLKPKWPWKAVPGFYKLKMEKADEIRNNSDKLGEFIVTRGWVPQ
jgi:hypothetical protein